MLKPGQWSDLLNQLRKIDNPVVPTKPSKYAIPVKKPKRASDAHQRRVGALGRRALFAFVQLEFGFLLGPRRRALHRPRQPAATSRSTSSSSTTLGAPQRRFLSRAQGP